ncbi:FeoA family protein [Ectothiorhodospira lacustris]|uniref:FeoA family protein n=1 Tax=Ectothiorhodospira lacustris TaxID=2899127 RepID=UPI001EE924EB|nr:ferrous iron transport protein A [Ectothiorhodospira lacustris]MCG5501571.1 ferrous iron transport protein A [Ectothiorhodospira lacustris]
MSCAELDQTLDQVQPGQSCRILRLTAAGSIRQRLLDMGLLPGRRIQLVRLAPLGDPLEVRLDAGDSFVAIRRQEAFHITVTLEACTPSR